jgi:signal transduction histidine kinase
VEEFNGGFMPNYCFSDGKLLLPNIKGFSEVNPDVLESEQSLKPITEIDEIIVNDSLKYGNTDTITFYGGNNSLRISFYADNFRPASNLHYQHILQGIEEQWSAPIIANEARYQFLQPGTYTFKARSVNAAGGETSFDSVVIIVKPTFTQSLFFKLLLIGTLASVVLTIIIWRIRVVKKVAEEKTNYAAYIAKAELQALHAQINPHFIFNCLNSIKYCVSENNFEQADKYIDHFSVLLRRFLEYSERESIRINDEIEILMHYLELEKYRFDSKFEYKIEVEAELRLHYIPTNIIQPIVENAIKHGIAHDEKQCNLLIQIIRHDEWIRCIIDDDGIGRGASKKINASFKKHESKGLGLIIEKKNILKKIDNIDLQFEIVDKKNSLGESLGTKVIIEIPINYDKSTDNRRRNHRAESDEEVT